MNPCNLNPQCSRVNCVSVSLSHPLYLPWFKHIFAFIFLCKHNSFQLSNYLSKYKSTFSIKVQKDSIKEEYTYMDLNQKSKVHGNLKNHPWFVWLFFTGWRKKKGLRRIESVHPSPHVSQGNFWMVWQEEAYCSEGQLWTNVRRDSLATIGLICGSKTGLTPLITNSFF